MVRSRGARQRHPSIGWFASGLGLLGCTATPQQIKNGDSPPDRALLASACPKGTRWLGSDPNAPLAVTNAGAILDARECCAAWARRGEPWLAVDSWGRIVGVAEVSGASGNEVTQCYDLDLVTTKGVAGSGLYASPDFSGSTTFAWEPSAEELKSLRAFVAHADSLLASDSGEALEWQQRTRFFTAGRERYALVGGWGLLLDRLDGVRWHTAFVEAELHSQDANVPSDTYRPVAVFDMTGDGFPEVVFVRGGDALWDEDILHRGSGVWQRARTGVGGSSI